MNEQLNELKCPECGGRLTKQGVVWSGRRRAQRYLCSACGLSTVKPQPVNQDSPDVAPQLEHSVPG